VGWERIFVGWYQTNSWRGNPGYTPGRARLALDITTNRGFVLLVDLDLDGLDPVHGRAGQSAAAGTRGEHAVQIFVAGEWRMAFNRGDSDAADFLYREPLSNRQAGWAGETRGGVCAGRLAVFNLFDVRALGGAAAVGYAGATIWAPDVAGFTGEHGRFRAATVGLPGDRGGGARIRVFQARGTEGSGARGATAGTGSKRIAGAEEPTAAALPFQYTARNFDAAGRRQSAREIDDPATFEFAARQPAIRQLGHGGAGGRGEVHRGVSGHRENAAGRPAGGALEHWSGNARVAGAAVDTAAAGGERDHAWDCVLERGWMAGDRVAGAGRAAGADGTEQRAGQEPAWDGIWTAKLPSAAEVSVFR